MLGNTYKSNLELEASSYLLNYLQIDLCQLMYAQGNAQLPFDLDFLIPEKPRGESWGFAADPLCISSGPLTRVSGHDS